MLHEEFPPQGVQADRGVRNGHDAYKMLDAIATGAQAGDVVLIDSFRPIRTVPGFCDRAQKSRTSQPVAPCRCLFEPQLAKGSMDFSVTTCGAGGE